MTMKKYLAGILAAVMVFAAGCGTADTSSKITSGTSEVKTGTPMKKEDIKVGFIYIGKINDAGYTQAHDKGRLAIEDMGIKTMYLEDVSETPEAVLKAGRTLVDGGCNVIYANSFGFMDYVKQLSEEFPNVKFNHCSGYTRTENMSSYFGKIEEPRYLAGIVAGLKTKTNKIGYVAAFGIPEVIRGINAFTLGVQSVNPNATVEVVFTNTWYDPALEKQAALQILTKDIDVLAQHQDTTAPQIAAQEKGVFAIGYNTPTPDAAPQAYLTAPLFHWEKYYVENVQRVIDGTWAGDEYWKGLEAGVVGLDQLSSLVAEGTQEKVDAALAKLKSGELKVFAGPLKDQSGTVKVAEGSAMTDAEIWSMNWFVEGVIGSIPSN